VEVVSIHAHTILEKPTVDATSTAPCHEHFTVIVALDEETIGDSAFPLDNLIGVTPRDALTVEVGNLGDAFDAFRDQHDSILPGEDGPCSVLMV